MKTGQAKYNNSSKVIMANLEAKSQLDFKLVHNEFSGIKNIAMMTFLAHEQINLKEHIARRTL